MYAFTINGKTLKAKAGRTGRPPGPGRRAPWVDEADVFVGSVPGVCGDEWGRLGWKVLVGMEDGRFFRSLTPCSGTFGFGSPEGWNPRLGSLGRANNGSKVI